MPTAAETPILICVRRLLAAEFLPLPESPASVRVDALMRRATRCYASLVNVGLKQLPGKMLELADDAAAARSHARRPPRAPRR